MAFDVLLVEDEAVVAVGLRAMVQDMGHEVVGVAHSGEEGLDLAAEVKPDLAIVDVKLPGIDGISTTQRLVDEYGIAVIILTAYADPEFIEGAAAAGAFAYLLKPVSKETLCASLTLASARSSDLASARKDAEEARAAMEVRKLSERAKHILMSRLGLNEADAFSHLRQKCRNQNKTMRQVSEQILLAEEAFATELDKDPPKKPRMSVQEIKN